MHMVRHIARGIASYGPAHSWWMYVYERMNSWICRRVTNRRHPEANVMETYRVSGGMLHSQLFLIINKTVQVLQYVQCIFESMLKCVIFKNFKS